MATHFIFTRKQRSSALLLVFNAGVALVLYEAAHRYLPILTTDNTALNELFDVLDIAIWFIEATLLGLALWFWYENKEIRVCVSSTKLSYFDPTFSDISWQVNIDDIMELKQISDTRQNIANFIELKSGEKKQLMYHNYHGFNRHAFFEALAAANPSIILPDNPNRYKTQRPAWAKRIRKKFGRDE
ncbi:hypothetical protein BM528_04330 [Alteromonas sp. RW2A1]|uniref:hypothetical protein n=1 Tax=Alteromonas sp. RW2A1 TaxID=1917158 RepID=UPI0009032623|nr:hypothetical protein [Alteromonas sp. RW2A1]APE05094.1 hypothetical protein BM528_04330 [Alteromonas sp. RW2A1]